MTTLEAVNEILEWVGQPAVSALDTGGTSEASEAENTLNRVNKQVQDQGWSCNFEKDVTLMPATRKITVTSATVGGTFTWGEAVSQATSGATGTFLYLEGTSMYVLIDSGSAAFDNSNLITGATSAATRTASAVATVTSSKLAFSTSYLVVAPSEFANELQNVVPRGTFLYDADNATSTFSGSVHIEATNQLAFTDLPHSLAAYISKQAAAQYHEFKLAGVPLSQARGIELQSALTRALQEDGDLDQTNILTTREALAVKGNRYSSVYRTLQTSSQ